MMVVLDYHIFISYLIQVIDLHEMMVDINHVIIQINGTLQDVILSISLTFWATSCEGDKVFSQAQCESPIAAVKGDATRATKGNVTQVQMRHHCQELRSKVENTFRYCIRGTQSNESDLCFSSGSWYPCSWRACIGWSTDKTAIKCAVADRRGHRACVFVT